MGGGGREVPDYVGINSRCVNVVGPVPDDVVIIKRTHQARNVYIGLYGWQNGIAALVAVVS